MVGSAFLGKGFDDAVLRRRPGCSKTGFERGKLHLVPYPGAGAVSFKKPDRCRFDPGLIIRVIEGLGLSIGIGCVNG